MSDNNANDMSINDGLVSEFLTITGIADANQATSYLEMSGGDLETAVDLYMEHNMGGGSGGDSAAPFGGSDIMGGISSGSSGSDGGVGGAGIHGVMHDAMGVGAPYGTMDGDIRRPDKTVTETLLPSGVDSSYHMAIDDVRIPDHPARFAFSDTTGSFDARALVNAAASASAPVSAALAGSHAAAMPAGISDANGRSSRRKKTSNAGDDDEKSDSAGDSDEDKENDDEADDDDVEMIDTTFNPSQNGPPPPVTLADMYAPPNHLIHKGGGFRGARAAAKDSRRWLLVNLQRDGEFSCHALNRDVWRDELVENLVREGFIFWQSMDVAPEGLTYAERYSVNEYPHLAILDPRTARLMWRKDGWSQENPVTASVFAEIAMDFCSRNSFDKPPTAPRPRGASGGEIIPKKINEMTEAEQLAKAMKASLEDANNNRSAGGADNREDSKQPAATSADAASTPKQPTLIDELIAMDVGDEPGTGARMQFRMPDGKRIIRKFNQSDTVKAIYAFVAQSNDEAKAGREFILLAGFPPNDLIINLDSTIESCSLNGETLTFRWK